MFKSWFLDHFINVKSQNSLEEMVTHFNNVKSEQFRSDGYSFQ